MPRRCALGCKPTSSIIHVFPNPDKFPEQFAAWLKIASRMSDCNNNYKNMKICDRHFTDKDKNRNNRLNALAVPSLFLPSENQSSSTFVDIDHSYCRPRRGQEHDNSTISIANLPVISCSQTENISDQSSGIHLTEFSVPNEFISTDCLSSSENYSQLQNLKPQIDADSECPKKTCAKKVLQLQKDVSRLRKRIVTLKLRLKQEKQVNAKGNFQKLSRNMSESAKLFTRMQCVGGRKKARRHSFTAKEKTIALCIYKKSPEAYRIMCEHFTMPSKRSLEKFT